MIRPLLLITVIAGPAQAGSFAAPKGCTAYLTVQSANCQVEHHWTCKDDAEGEKWHGEVNQNGTLIYIGKVDHEAQWIDSFFVASNERELLIRPVADPASLTELFSAGLDTYDFMLETPGGKRQVLGYDRIVERDIRIDGEPLHRTEYSIRIIDEAGDLTYASEGSEYVSETYRRFFSGYGDVTGPGTPYSYRSNPVEFIYPGEKGYLDNTPKYGCDVITARAVMERKDATP